MSQRPEPSLWAKLRQAARDMRGAPTKAEAVLWAALKAGRGGSAKFRRQQAIGQFIVDFYCRSANLVIEVDGPIHETQQEHDAERQAMLETMGFNVLRFTNDDVLERLTTTLETIRLVVDGPLAQRPT
jgi:very-short-patch-repair endonuclease